MNHYSNHIKLLFERLLELRHIVSHLKSILRHSVKNFNNTQGIDMINASALAITDWTGQMDNGYPVLNHTGIRKRTYQAGYEQEIENIISQECCFAYAQSFEAFEKFIKDCVFTKIMCDVEYCKILKIEDSSKFQRENVPGGDLLFKWIKKACDPIFTKYSENNNLNIRFKECWTVLSNARHAITHSNAIIEIKKIHITDYHLSIFNTFFASKQLDSNTIKIVLGYEGLCNLTNLVSEFGFQIFKMLSTNEELDWKILK